MIFIKQLYVKTIIQNKIGWCLILLEIKSKKKNNYKTKLKKINDNEIKIIIKIKSNICKK